MSNQLLSFDDITLIPQYSEIESRSDPDTKCEIGKFSCEFPILSANMDTITQNKMAIEMWELGGMGVLHRFMPSDNLVQEYAWVREAGADCFVTLGVKWTVDEIAALINAGATHFMVDIAHGHSSLMKKAITRLRTSFGSSIVIAAGNVATPEGVSDLADWGADIVKVGVGGGSICKTRVVTGHGVPMFSCILECARAAELKNVKIIADGGIKSSGDVVKAFVAGADSVMLGSLLSGTDETPGGKVLVPKTVETPYDEYFKEYRGMASSEAQGDRQWGSNNVKVAPEGVATYVPCKGPVENVVQELVMGLKSGMSYCNAKKLSEIHTNAKWRQQTHAAYIEGTPHILKQ